MSHMFGSGGSLESGQTVSAEHPKDTSALTLYLSPAGQESSRPYSYISGEECDTSYISRSGFEYDHCYDYCECDCVMQDDQDEMGRRASKNHKREPQVENRSGFKQKANRMSSTRLCNSCPSEGLCFRMNSSQVLWH